MKPYLIVFAIFFINLCIKAQDQRKISGRVQNQHESVALEFAHIYIKNGFIGTYTNAEGKFTLNYPDSLAQDTLVVSRIGYSIYMLPLPAEDTSTSLHIYIKESKNYLDEVVITTHKDTVSAIVKKVLKKFRKNYPTKLHYLEGFYRELSTKGDRYTRLIEASVGITENSYRKNQTNSKIKVKQVRKSEDYREYNLNSRLYVNAFKKATELAWGKTYINYNNITRLLKLNFPRSNQMINFEKDKRAGFFKSHEFEITKIIKDQEALYYHISYYLSPETSGPFMYQGGSMVINMDDFAIIEWTWAIIPHPYKRSHGKDPQSDSFFYRGKYHRKNHVLYSKIDNKYYPTYLELHEPILGTEKHTFEESGKEEFQYKKMTLMVNQVVTRKKDFDRIKKRDALEEEKDLYGTNHQYDSDFWTNYNILLLDPLLKPAIEDLEKEKSLNEQFENNGE